MPRNPHATARRLTDAEYAALLDAQGGRCAIQSADYSCMFTAKTRRFHHDHDHRDGRTRGLLCHAHNRRLWTTATPAELRALADYLERSQP